MKAITERPMYWVSYEISKAQYRANTIPLLQDMYLAQVKWLQCMLRALLASELD